MVIFMMLYSRDITYRQVDHTGWMTLSLVREYIATEDITPYNRRKRIRFEPVDDQRGADTFLPEKITRVYIKTLKEGPLW